MKKLTIGSLVLGFISLTSLASGPQSNSDLDVGLNDVIPRYGQETKFDILKNAYEASSHAADDSDFEYYRYNESLRTYRCEFVNKGNPEQLMKTTVAIFTKKIPANPGNGPIFPGTPERTEEKVFVGADSIYTEKNFPLFLNKKSHSDFIVQVPKNMFGIYSEVGSGVMISFRKTDGYLPFKMEKEFRSDTLTSPSSKCKDLCYGYCYKKKSDLKIF
jgi:hypothetical protein